MSLSKVVFKVNRLFGLNSYRGLMKKGIVLEICEDKIVLVKDCKVDDKCL